MLRYAPTNSAHKYYYEFCCGCASSRTVKDILKSVWQASMRCNWCRAVPLRSSHLSRTLSYNGTCTWLQRRHEHFLSTGHSLTGMGRFYNRWKNRSQDVRLHEGRSQSQRLSCITGVPCSVLLTHQRFASSEQNYRTSKLVQCTYFLYVAMC